MVPRFPSFMIFSILLSGNPVVFTIAATFAFRSLVIVEGLTPIDAAISFLDIFFCSIK